MKTTPMIEELQKLQADLVILEGMIGMLKQSAYSGTKSVLLGNSLEVLEEFLGTRTDRLDGIVTGGMC